jgi:hypothetical protein
VHTVSQSSDRTVPSHSGHSLTVAAVITWNLPRVRLLNAVEIGYLWRLALDFTYR